MKSKEVRLFDGVRSGLVVENLNVHNLNQILGLFGVNQLLEQHQNNQEAAKEGDPPINDIIT